MKKIKSQLPIYVDRWQRRGSPQPFDCHFVSGHHFVFLGKQHLLEDLCERYLNQPTQGELRYVPFLPFVLVIFNDVARDSAGGSRYRDVGWSPERAVAIFVLTASVRRTSVAERIDHLAWFCPYMFIDGNPIAISLGREVYGFPKEAGLIDMDPSDGGGSPSYKLEAFGVKTFDASSKLDWIEILRITEKTTETNQAAASSFTERVSDLLRSTSEILWEKVIQKPLPSVPGFGDLTSGAKTMLELFRRDIPLVFLKQFYDADNGDRACYQAIIEAPLRVTLFTDAKLVPGTYALNLFRRPSHPIEDDLGLTNGAEAPFAYWVRWNAILERGRKVWPL